MCEKMCWMEGIQLKKKEFSSVPNSSISLAVQPALLYA